MAVYKTFQELPCWQRARKFASRAEEIIEASAIKKHFKLRDQMLGSSGSVMDNIAEGFDRSTNGDFVRFLYYSKGSAAEFQSQLFRALDGGRITQQEFEELSREAKKIGDELGKFIKYLSSYNPPNWLKFLVLKQFENVTGLSIKQVEIHSPKFTISNSKSAIFNYFCSPVRMSGRD